MSSMNDRFPASEILCARYFHRHSLHLDSQEHRSACSLLPRPRACPYSRVVHLCQELLRSLQFPIPAPLLILQEKVLFHIPAPVENKLSEYDWSIQLCSEEVERSWTVQPGLEEYFV